jgi:teichuronic acid biosynthesis glycosyltransferase TuaC
VVVLVPRATSTPKDPGIQLVPLPHLGAFGWPGAIERLRQNPARTLGAALWVVMARRALHRLGPFDRIVTHWVIPSFWPITQGTESPTELVIHGSDLGVLERLPMPICRHIASELTRRSPSVRCVSEDLHLRLVRWLRRWVPAPLEDRRRGLEQRICVAPASLFIPALLDRTALRAKLALGERRVALVVGRLVPSKRVEVALEALLLLGNVDIVVIGDGPCLETLCHAFPGVRWLGKLPRSQTLEWIKAADLLVSASRDEGAPTAVREALALGTPVVALRSGDLLKWAKSDPNLTVVVPGGTLAHPTL